MKNELNKIIKNLCDEAGTSAAAEKCSELTDQLNTEFDARVKNGMSELDAYRDLLKDLDKIRVLLDNLPKNEEEEERSSRQRSYKWLSQNLSRISGCMWIAAAMYYFALSITSGSWHLTWLIVPWTAIGQIVLGMVKGYNRGKELKKVLKSGLSGILWILAAIIYFLASFTLGSAWHLTWLIFPFTAILQIILNSLFSD